MSVTSFESIFYLKKDSLLVQYFCDRFLNHTGLLLHFPFIGTDCAKVRLIIYFQWTHMQKNDCHRKTSKILQHKCARNQTKLNTI